MCAELYTFATKGPPANLLPATETSIKWLPTSVGTNSILNTPLFPSDDIVVGMLRFDGPTDE